MSAQEQLLHPPIRSLADVQLTLRRARERVRTGELSQVASRATDHPQHGAVERNLEDSSRVCRFPHEEHLSGPGRNAERIGCADRLELAGSSCARLLRKYTRHDGRCCCRSSRCQYGSSSQPHSRRPLNHRSQSLAGLEAPASTRMTFLHRGTYAASEFGVTGAELLLPRHRPSLSHGRA